MSVLVDTNILLRAVQLSSSLQQIVLDALAVLRGRGEQLWLVPQNLYEFWVAGTRPQAQNGLGLSILEPGIVVLSPQDVIQGASGPAVP